LDVLGPTAHADLERRRPDVLALRFQTGDPADPPGGEEVDVARPPEDALAARDAPRRERSRLGDPLHHPPAVDLARGARMLGKHPLDHLDDGVRDRRHTGTLPPCPARLEATAAPARARPSHRVRAPALPAPRSSAGLARAIGVLWGGIGGGAPPPPDVVDPRALPAQPCSWGRLGGGPPRPPFDGLAPAARGSFDRDGVEVVEARR